MGKKETNTGKVRSKKEDMMRDQRERQRKRQEEAGKKVSVIRKLGSCECARVRVCVHQDGGGLTSERAVSQTDWANQPTDTAASSTDRYSRSDLW
ncbi:hypothetical protein LSTR_LSTR005706 [Laodelphax striatellus]|uniref:Uncharacterized protein n=1 Tax=Laodelphax striatellus TaxID=195883 RepID=A0A482XQG0_LAOST|nr:hypothetical protein LSTR_LSTR005706 [Laodelphax striatellus]